MIPAGVFPVRRDIISKFILWTLAPKTGIPLKMVYVAILRAICKPCCYNQFATPEVTICTKTIVIPALDVGIGFQADRLEYQPEYVIQHLSVCVPLLIQPLLRNIAVLDWNPQESDH